jgi:hypothetical protein
MNEEAKKLREIVERATAAQDIPDDELPQALDAETAALRSGWLQLGKLIEEEVKSGARHNRNYDRCAAKRPATMHRGQAGWSLWIAVSAASLLVATGIAFAVRFLGGAHEPQKNLPQIAGSNVPPEQPVAPAVVRTPAPPQTTQPNPHIAETSDHLQWGDSVDDEISAVGEATIYAKQDVVAQSSGVLEIETGLDEITKEVEQGSL